MTKRKKKAKILIIVPPGVEAEIRYADPPEISHAAQPDVSVPWFELEAKRKADARKRHGGDRSK